MLYRFEGRLSYIVIGAQVYRNDPDEYSYRWTYNYNRTQRTEWGSVKTKVKTVVNRKQDRPAYVYTEYHLGEDGTTRFHHSYYGHGVPDIQRATIIIRKSEIKDLVPIDASEVKCNFAKSFKVPMGEPLIEVDYESHSSDVEVNRTNYTTNTNLSAGRQSAPILFASKKDTLEAIYTAQELLELFKPLEHDSRYYHGRRADGWYGHISYLHEDSLLTELTKEETDR